MSKRKKQSKNSPKTGKGLDVGTAFIYCAKKTNSQLTFKSQRDAFFDIGYSEFTENILRKSDINFIRLRDKLYVVGEDALKFANIFGKSTRRPLKRGVISPEEKEALPIIELFIKNLLGQSSQKDEICYYSLPGSPIDANFDTVYHENIIRGFLERLGYQPKPINEGLAVIFSELAEDNFTGIGISFGGGMANVCCAVLGMPVFTFSVCRAGDWIDEEVSQATNEPVSKITAFKESSLDLRKAETSLSRVEQALSIYYTHLIEYVLEKIIGGIERTAKIPEFGKPISIVISGGTTKPPGFTERFKGIFGKTNFPLKIKEVRLASHPLYTVAKGALIAAIADKEK